MLSFRTTLVVCLYYVSILTANPIDRIRELDLFPGKSPQSLQGSRSQFTTSNTNGKLCSSSDRLFKLQCRAHDFYIRRGAAIPWPLVVSAAQKFSSLAEHQSVNTFDAVYEEHGSAITVAISLHLLQEAKTLGGLLTTSLPLPSTPPTKRTPLQHQHQNRSQPPDPTATPPSLKPRAPASPSMGMTHFVRLGTLLPVEIAAQQFHDFYTIIALKIETGQLAQRLPSKRLVCSLWDFELVFSCDRIDVPLSFVQAFVIDMAEWSLRGFTGFYDATIKGEGPLAGLVFLVQMRLKGAAVGVGFGMEGSSSSFLD